MLRVAIVAGLAAIFMPGPVMADIQLATPDVEAAAREPRVAAALAARARIDDALVANDRAAFTGAMTAETIINSPQNTINRREQAAGLFERGLIHDEYFHSRIEYAGPRPGGEVVLMGEETLKPLAPHPQAGREIHRRFADVWREEAEGWKLVLRQATIYLVK